MKWYKIEAGTGMMKNKGKRILLLNQRFPDEKM